MKVCTSLAENGKKKLATELASSSSWRFFSSASAFFRSLEHAPAFRILGLRLLEFGFCATPNYPYDSDAHKLLGSFGSKPDKLPDLARYAFN